MKRTFWLSWRVILLGGLCLPLAAGTAVPAERTGGAGGDAAGLRLSGGADRCSPCRVHTFAPRLVSFQEGHHGSAPALTVVSTDGGLIVIDTGRTAAFAEGVRALFLEMFGRDNVLFVINTSARPDHTGGNGAFPDAVIVGHDDVVPALARLERELAADGGANPGPDAREELADSIARERAFIGELEAGRGPVPPSLTFLDRMTIETGGLTIDLYDYAGCFAQGTGRGDGDILVHIPELGALFTGDALAIHDRSLAPLPAPDRVSRWLEVVGDILKGPVSIVIDGRLDPRMGSGDMLRAMHRYTKELFDAARDARSAGLDVSAFQAGHGLAAKFPYLGPFFDLRSGDILGQHGDRMLKLWSSGRPPGP